MNISLIGALLRLCLTISPSLFLALLDFSSPPSRDFLPFHAIFPLPLSVNRLIVPIVP